MSNKKIGIDISNKLYHSSEKLSASKIKLLLENALKFKKIYITKEAKSKDTDAFQIGNLHHTLVMEPEHFDRDYVVLDIPTKSVKNDYVEAVEMLGGEIAYKENSKGELTVKNTIDDLKNQLEDLKKETDKQIVFKKNLDIAKETSQKALASDFVVETGETELLKVKLEDVLKLDECYVEKTFYGEICGVEIQIRPDILVNLSKNGEAWFVIDLKTSIDATLSEFAKQSSKFYYDIQEYIYREILKQNGIIVVDFRFCVSGKSEDSGSGFYKIHEEDIEDAEIIVERVLKKYKYCLENDIWCENRFDFKNMKFESTSIIKMPTYRKFQMIDLGLQ